MTIEEFNDLRRRYLENKDSVTDEELREAIRFMRQGRTASCSTKQRKTKKEVSLDDIFKF